MIAPVGIAAALASAACFGVATAGQFAAVGTTQSRGGLDPRLLRDLARTRLWWLSAAVEVVAVACQALALRNAPVVVVQALLVLGLPLAVVLSGVKDRRTVTGLLLTTTGVGVFAVLERDVAPGGRPSVVVPVVVALVVAAAMVRRPPPVVAGAVAGVVTGCASVLLAQAAATPLRQLLVRPALYAAAVIGLLALQVCQAALRADRLGPPLAALTLAEPVAAAVLAAVTLRQVPHLSLLAIGAAVLAAAGVLVLHVPEAAPSPLEPTP